MKTVNIFRDRKVYQRTFLARQVGSPGKALIRKNNQREPCSVNLLCQYTNDCHCLPAEERVGYPPLMWSCTLLSFHDRVKYSNYWILTEQLHAASSGLPGTQADIGRRHRGWVWVQLPLVLKDHSKRGRKFKSSLKYGKVMRCSQKILS